MTHSTLLSRITVSLSGILVLASAIGCDSSEPSECRLLEEDVYTNSAPAIEPMTLERFAVFELQQEIRTYEDGACEIPAEGFNEIRLVIRNLTSCELSFTYRLSVFEVREGSSIEDTATVRKGAASDEGVIMKNLDVRLDRAQLILTTWDVKQESCG